MFCVFLIYTKSIRLISNKITPLKRTLFQHGTKFGVGRSLFTILWTRRGGEGGRGGGWTAVRGNNHPPHLPPDPARQPRRCKTKHSWLDQLSNLIVMSGYSNCYCNIYCLSDTVDLSKIGVGADILPRQSDSVMNVSHHRPTTCHPLPPARHGAVTRLPDKPSLTWMFVALSNSFLLLIMHTIYDGNNNLYTGERVNKWRTVTEEGEGVKRDTSLPPPFSLPRAVVTSQQQTSVT